MLCLLLCVCGFSRVCVLCATCLFLFFFVGEYCAILFGGMGEFCEVVL